MVLIAERSRLLGEGITDRSADRDFDTLNRLKEEFAKFLIEAHELDNFVKIERPNQLMCSIFVFLLKIVDVPADVVIVLVGQDTFCFWPNLEGDVSGFQ